MPTARIKSTNVVISQSPQHHENEKVLNMASYQVQISDIDTGYRHSDTKFFRK